MATPLPIYKADFYAPSIGCPSARPRAPACGFIPFPSCSAAPRPRPSQSVDGYHYRCNARFIRGRQFARVALTLGQNASGSESELHSESNSTPWAQLFPLHFSKRGPRGMRIVLLFSTFDIQVTFPFPSPLSIPHTRPTEATI